MYAEYDFQMTTLNGMKTLSSPIRVKPMASITAIVMRRALAIMRFVGSESFCRSVSVQTIQFRRGSGRRAIKHRRPSRSSSGVSRKKTELKGCGACGVESARIEEKVARGGWAEDARRPARHQDCS